MDYLTNVFLSQKDLKLIYRDKNYILVKSKYGPSKLTKIPLRINEDIAFFSAAIIGDGHLRKDKSQISFEVHNKKLISYLLDICKINFDRDFNLKFRYKNGKIFYHFFIDSKAIYNLLIFVFEIPPGRKSHLVKVPECIKNSSFNIKYSFLKGIMLTEGGKRKKGYGLSTASLDLWVDLIDLFKSIGIIVKKDKWLHKRYKKEYYGISFRESEYLSLLRGCQSGQMGRV